MTSQLCFHFMHFVYKDTTNGNISSYKIIIFRPPYGVVTSAWCGISLSTGTTLPLSVHVNYWPGCTLARREY